MREKILPFLVCPICKSGFTLKVEQVDEDHIEEGKLICRGCGEVFKISSGIPRLLVKEKIDSNAQQTSESFDIKWRTVHSFGWNGTTKDFRENWYYERYHWSPEEFKSFLSSKKLILDAGTGTGHDAAWYASRTKGEVFGIDLSDCIELAYQNTKTIENTHIIQADILNLPFKEGTFDFIASEGVLHHTPSTKLALESLVNLVVRGGEISIYVYKKKAPIREFCDDYIREHTTKLSPEECWKVCEAITMLGRELSNLKAGIEVPDIPILKIKQGRYDLQWFLYYHFIKCFWNDDWTYEQNVATNFDWYHPKYAHRQSPEDVKRWFEELGLETVVFDVGDSGISVRAIKRCEPEPDEMNGLKKTFEELEH